MKIAAMISRYLLAVVFLVFGANLIFPFLPNPPIPPGPVKDFTTVLATTHYAAVIGFFQALPGLLLLINRYVPLALTILAAELVNILSFHIFIAQSGIFPVPIVVAILWLLVFWSVRSAFAGIFEAKVQS